jgi:hypothetical protein
VNLGTRAVWSMAGLRLRVAIRVLVLMDRPPQP